MGHSAGYGWFIGSTLTDDSEFPAVPGSPAHGKVDLLTVVEHELGHELGFADNAGNDLMGEFLATGVRRMPPSVAATSLPTPQGMGGTTYTYLTGADNAASVFNVAEGFALIYAESFVGGTDYAYNHDRNHNLLGGNWIMLT